MTAHDSSYIDSEGEQRCGYYDIEDYCLRRCCPEHHHRQCRLHAKHDGDHDDGKFRWEQYDWERK